MALRQRFWDQWTTAVRFGVCAMCCSMLHSLFTSFYVDYFVRGKLRHETHHGGTAETLTIFTIGQVAYAVWNGLNDLGFGWFGDTHFKRLDRRRFGRIMIGGPAWAFVFFLLWLPIPNVIASWMHPAITFSIMMILYDGFFSFTSVAFRALLTDISTNSREREVCNATAAVFHVVGSMGVGIASYLYESDSNSDEKDLSRFRVFMTMWAAMAGVGFVLASAGGSEAVLKQPSKHESTRPAENTSGILQFASEVFRRRSMFVAVVVWAIQEYSCTFATNFFSMFIALGCSDALSAGTRSVLLLLSFLAPHAVTLGVTPLIPRIGKKSIIGFLFFSRLIVGFLTLMLARSASGDTVQKISRVLQVQLAVLLFLNRVLTEGVCRLQGLVLSDITDEDTVMCSRPHSHAASINGLVSLVSKPFQSLAPVLTCYFLANHGALSVVSASSVVPTNDGVIRNSFVVVSTLVGLTSMISSGSMWVIWREFYTLDGAYLQQIQSQMKLRQDAKGDGRSSTKYSQKSETYV